MNTGLVRDKASTAEMIRYRVAGDPRWRYSLNEHLIDMIGRGEYADDRPVYDPSTLRKAA